jgi:DinB family protein
MASIWLESLGRSFEEALDLMAAALRDCAEELWETSMWQVPAWDPDHELIDARGKPVTDTAQRLALVQRHSTPWAVAWHALECLDYDLTGEFGPWAPPPPFAGNPHWRLTSMSAAWSRSEMLAYVDYCRERVCDTLAGMTDERAATPLPPAHRYSGQPHLWIVTGAVGHTVEHAAQIRQFINDAGAGGMARVLASDTSSRRTD